MSFKSLKRNKTKISKLVEEAEKSSGSKNYGDDRVWKITRDKSGNGYAVIRFLPATDESSLPWIQYWDHGFKGPTGQWYIEKSLTTVGKDDPVSELNSKLWNSGIESDKEIARKQKRRLHFVSNIYVVSDPAHPENEGKNFLFIYGKKIFDKLMDSMKPQFEDEVPLNPFDLWEGANFKLKIRTVDNFPNYDKSEFGSSEALFEDDEKLEEIFDKMYPLGEFTDPEKYKSYDELKAKLYRVLQLNYDAPKFDEPVKKSPEPKSVEQVETNQETQESDEDDAFSFFENLVKEEA